MRIFIAGATGILGRRLIKEWIAAGYSVVGLVRNRQGEQIVKSLGAEPRYADLFNFESLASAAEGCTTVVHAATSIPVKIRTSAKDWEMNDRIRREGTTALTACTAKIGATLYLQQSVVWVARPPDGSFFDENTKNDPDPIYRSSYDGERIAFEAGERHRFRVVVLRCGMFYDDESRHIGMMREGLIKRKVPIIGNGDTVWAMIHSDDVARAFRAAAGAKHTGLWHIVDDQPVTVKELFNEFAAKLNAPPPRHVPLWLAQLIMGKAAVKHLTISTRTSNARFCKEFGWKPLFPSYKEGLKEIAEKWKG